MFDEPAKTKPIAPAMIFNESTKIEDIAPAVIDLGDFTEAVNPPMPAAPAHDLGMFGEPEPVTEAAVDGFGEFGGFEDPPVVLEAKAADDGFGIFGDFEDPPEKEMTAPIELGSPKLDADDGFGDFGKSNG